MIRSFPISIPHDHHRVTLILVVVLTALLTSLTPSFGYAQEVAVVISADFPPYHQAVRGFRSQIPSSSEVTTYQMNGDMLQGREMAKRIRASEPTVVLAVGLKAALVAKLEIVDTPVVFCLVLNPADYGLPTSNMVGIDLRVSGIQQLRTIQSIVPSTKTIGVIYDPDHSDGFVSQAHSAAQALGLSLQSQTISDSTELPDTLRALLPKVEVLWLIRDSTVITEASIPFILETALSYHRPVFGFSSGLAQHGAIAAMSVDYVKLGQQAGGVAQSLITGHGLSPALPSLLPPRDTQLALNLGTSHFLGIVPNPKVIQLAAAIFGGPEALAQREESEGVESSLDPGTNMFPLP